MSAPSALSRPSWIARAETLTLCLMGIWFLDLLWVVISHAGPLWRDEINTRWMALRPNPLELWRNMCFDSFPFVWFFVVRGWIAAGLAQTDQGFRWLGATIGLGALLASLWVARFQSKRWPLVFVALFALSPVLIRFGTSLRAYGMGVLTMLLMIGFLWAFVDRPDPRRFIASAFASLIAVHTLYYNSTVLAVLCIAGGCSLLMARQRRAFLALGALGLVSALSVTPYILGPLHRAGSWGSFIRGKVTLGLLLERCRWTIEAPLSGLAWVWVVAALAVLVGCAVGLFRWHSPRRRRRALFVLLALPLAFATHFSFLMTLSILTQPWYYITFLAFTALLIDRGADLLIRRHRAARALRILAVAAVVILAARSTFDQAHIRMTTVDAIARTIDREGTDRDIAVIQPWYHGISFDYYYRGDTAWSTLPTVTGLHIHRIDLLRDSMMNPEGAQPLLQRVREVLDSGHRVWYVGDPQLPPPGRKVRAIPMPTEEGGVVTPVDLFWAYHLGYEVVLRQARVTPVDLRLNQPLSAYESPPLYVIEAVKK